MGSEALRQWSDGPDGHRGEQCPKVGMESIHTHFSGYGLGSQYFNILKLVRLFGADRTGRFAGYPSYHKSKPALHLSWGMI